MLNLDKIILEFEYKYGLNCVITPDNNSHILRVRVYNEVYPPHYAEATVSMQEIKKYKDGYIIKDVLSILANQVQTKMNLDAQTGKGKSNKVGKFDKWPYVSLNNSSIFNYDKYICISTTTAPYVQSDAFVDSIDDLYAPPKPKVKKTAAQKNEERKLKAEQKEANKLGKSAAFKPVKEDIDKSMKYMEKILAQGLAKDIFTYDLDYLKEPSNKKISAPLIYTQDESPAESEATSTVEVNNLNHEKPEE